VRQHESKLLFNHSVRVFLFGAMKGIRQESETSTLNCSSSPALFHDLGLVGRPIIPRQSVFEVDGADAGAAEFAQQPGIPRTESGSGVGGDRPAYDACVPQYMRPEIALTNAGGPGDARRIGYDEYTHGSNGRRSSPTFPACDFNE